MIHTGEATGDDDFTGAYIEPNVLESLAIDLALNCNASCHHLPLNMYNDMKYVQPLTPYGSVQWDSQGVRTVQLCQVSSSAFAPHTVTPLSLIHI